MRNINLWKTFLLEILAQQIMKFAVFLTFSGPCSIVIYSYNKTTEMHYFLKFIFGIELYMFRQVFCPSSGV